MPTSLFTRLCLIALLGIVVGGVHSWVTPIQLRVKQDQLLPTVLPAKPSNDASQPSAASSNPGQPAAPSQASTPTQANPPAPEVRTLGLDISVADAQALFEIGTPFIDARAEHEMGEGHIPNAVWIPGDQIMANLAKAAPFSPGPVVIYCSGGECHASHNVATALQGIGFNRIHVMTEGFPGWKAKNLPIDAGRPTR